MPLTLRTSHRVRKVNNIHDNLRRWAEAKEPHVVDARKLASSLQKFKDSASKIAYPTSSFSEWVADKPDFEYCR